MLPVATPDHDRAIDRALAHAHAIFIEAHPESRRLFDANARYMPGANSRSTLFAQPFPVTIARGEDARLWDVDGHCRSDFIGEYSAGVYGHSAPQIRDAVMQAMAEGINLCGHNLYEGRLAQLICERFASIERVRFTNSGSEATLMCLTAARHVTRRSKIVAFRGAYHGGFFSFGDEPAVTNAPYDVLLLDYNDTEQALQEIRAQGSDIAAVIVEPMLGAGGCIPATREFLQALRDVTCEVGCLLIFDEVMTSRLAGHGLQHKLDIRPDLTALGKYIGGGLSFGAFGGRASLMAHFDPRSGALLHSGTFNNNVMSMAAGYAGLTQLYPPEAAEALSRRGEALRERLNRLCVDAGVALQFTGVGSVMNAHFVRGRVLRPRDVAGVDKRLRQLFFHHLLANGFYIAARGFIVLSLPLTDTDCDGFAAAVEGFISRYREML
jgi:glutamate-1-semialdehyde 2,1-aminomutase